jgi:hypothetical protein
MLQNLHDVKKNCYLVARSKYLEIKHVKPIGAHNESYS